MFIFSSLIYVNSIITLLLLDQQSAIAHEQRWMRYPRYPNAEIQNVNSKNGERRRFTSIHNTQNQPHFRQHKHIYINTIFFNTIQIKRRSHIIIKHVRMLAERVLAGKVEAKWNKTKSQKTLRAHTHTHNELKSKYLEWIFSCFWCFVCRIFKGEWWMVNGE